MRHLWLWVGLVILIRSGAAQAASYQATATIYFSISSIE